MPVDTAGLMTTEELPSVSVKGMGKAHAGADARNAMATTIPMIGREENFIILSDPRSKNRACQVGMAEATRLTAALHAGIRTRLRGRFKRLSSRVSA
jgi:hypothetical protein